MPLTATVTRHTDEPAPLEGQDATGGAGANVMGELESTLGVSLETKAIGAGASALGIGSQPVPYDQAQAQMKSENLDPSVLPKDAPVSTAMLHAVMNQQMEIQRDRDIVNRAHLGGATQFVTSLVGGAADPLFLGLGPVAGRVAGPLAAAAGLGKGLALGARLTIGGAEGVGTMGAYDVAKKTFGSAQGDPDITAGQVLHDMAIGGIFGGVFNGTFGARPQAPGVSGFDSAVKFTLAQEGGLTTDTGGLTKFGISKNAHPNVDVANLTQDQASKIYQSEYWNKINGDALPSGMQQTAFESAVNQGVAKTQGWLKAAGGDVDKFNDLREADYRRLAAENPQKYGKYLNGWLARLGRARGVEAGPSPETTQNAAKVAVLQASQDSPVNVEPILKSDAAWGVKGSDVDPTSAPDLSDAIPKPGSAFGTDPDVAVTLKRVQETSTEGPVGPSGEANPELVQLQKTSDGAVAEAEHAHLMATGTKPEAEAHPFQNALASEDEITANDDTLAKAVDAAVRCGTLKGFA